MDITQTLRDPLGAAVVAAIVTAGYIHIKSKMNKEGPLETSAYAKPAALVGILVFLIISNGVGRREVISTDPY